MSKTKFSAKKWFNDNMVYLAAFILPVVSMVIIYAFKEIFPFGDNMYLRSDNYHQYTPYLQILQDKLHEGGSLFYTWEIGTGMNFLAIAAYYLSSPLNLLLLVWPGKVVDIVAIFIISKMGLASFAMTYYLCKKFDKKSMVTALFGMAYALSAYFAAFSWNIMWLDCMFLLPFIILGLERLVKEGKYLMYLVTLGIAIFSNYYIGIMLCIFSVLYFAYLFFTSDVPEGVEKKIYYVKTLVTYGISSLLAGGLAAMVILPEYFNLLTTRSADSEFPEAISRYFSVLYMLFRSLIYIPVADLKYPYDPNIYCSLAVFLLIPLFFMCGKIKAKERIGKAVLMVIMLLSFSLNIPNYIWHGMHFPNSLPCRESFIYIFLILTLAYEAALHIREFTSKQIVGVFAGAAGLILVLEEMFEDAEFFSDMVIKTDIFKIIYYSLAALTVYVVLIMLYRTKSEIKGFIVYLLVLASFCELTMNMYTTSIPSTSNRTGYYESNDAYDKLNKIAKDDAAADGYVFYRSEEASHRTRNDGALFGYNSISTFSSVSAAAIQYYYDDIGLQTSFNAYAYEGATPLTAALFSVKYEFTTGEPTMPLTSTLLSSTTYADAGNNNVNLNVYENNYVLPLGFMIDSGTMSNWFTDSGNPFDVQNGFLKAAIPSFDKNIFHKLLTDGAGMIQTQLSLEDNDNYTESKDTSSYDVYFYIPTSAENLTATITSPDGTSSTKSFSATHQHYICHVGEVSAGSTVNVTANDGTSISGLFAYTFDIDAFSEAYAVLNSEKYVVDSYDDTHISGSITTANGGMMYTSIPYDNGWSVYVDGVKVNSSKICKDALLGVTLPAGTHKVEFKYMPDGFVSGLAISLVSILIVLVLAFHTQIFEFISRSADKKKSRTDVSE